MSYCTPTFFQYLANVENLINSRSITTESELANRISTNKHNSTNGTMYKNG